MPEGSAAGIGRARGRIGFLTRHDSPASPAEISKWASDVDATYKVVKGQIWVSPASITHRIEHSHGTGGRRIAPLVPRPSYTPLPGKSGEHSIVVQG